MASNDLGIADLVHAYEPRTGCIVILDKKLEMKIKFQGPNLTFYTSKTFHEEFGSLTVNTMIRVVRVVKLNEHALTIRALKATGKPLRISC